MSEIERTQHGADSRYLEAVPAPGARCSLTELRVTECAHCRGIPDPAAPERRTRELGPVIAAMYPGDCSGCAGEIEPGDAIRADGDGGWLHDGCGEDKEA